MPALPEKLTPLKEYPFKIHPSGHCQSGYFRLNHGLTWQNHNVTQMEKKIKYLGGS
jgi:hypothetical protein